MVLISGKSHRALSKMSSFPSEVIGTDKSESTSGQVRMGRSKTEKLIPNILAEDAARIFDDNVPVQQKV